MSPRLPLVCVLFAVIASAPAAVLATTVLHLDTPTLVEGSSDIVIAKVESKRSYLSEDRRHIFTEVTVQVIDRLKGGVGAQIRLTQLGGEVDGMRYTVPGAPLFQPGEETLLFLWRDPRGGSTQVNGLAQGKFEITQDPDTGERFVQRSLPGLAVRDPRTLSLAAKGQPAPRIRLSTMLREVRHAIGAEGER